MIYLLSVRSKPFVLGECSWPNIVWVSHYYCWWCEHRWPVSDPAPARAATFKPTFHGAARRLMNEFSG